ncbi:I20L2 protein, partial [Picathartes gymnocephalus]|nr:I20L2 protein [Picathartes gymnocephalus]
GNRKHQSFVRRRRELERRGVLRQKQLPAAPGGPRRDPGRGAGRAGVGPRKPRSGLPRSCPKETGPAAAPRCPPVPQNGPSATNAPAKTKGKSRGAARGTPKTGGAPPASPKLVAMDCEMVGTGPGGRTSALARCSIVTYEGD